jgi:cystathionine gamma-synthase
VSSTHPDTLLAQAGRLLDEATGAVTPAIQTSVTFARDADHQLRGAYVYARNGSPVDGHVESVLADLEGGSAAAVFASGLAAVAAVIETVPEGGHVVAPSMMYHAAQDWLHRLADRGRIELSLFDPSDPPAMSTSLRRGITSIMWVETPINPTWQLIDIAAAADAAHSAGAVLVVDSTVAPAVTQRPLLHGADLVVHSSTKYLNGHSDVMGGVVVTGSIDDRWQEILEVRRLSGGIAGPFASWLLLRGLRTLHLRYRRQSETALRIAKLLSDHPSVGSVHYPGLPTHPGHEIAAGQMIGGFGGMLSIRLAGGADAARAVVSAVEVWIPATSLGGVESLIEHRAVVEGPHSTVPDDLVRLSVGIEDADDLIADLEQALQRTGEGSSSAQHRVLR